MNRLRSLTTITLLAHLADTSRAFSAGLWACSSSSTSTIAHQTRRARARRVSSLDAGSGGSGSMPSNGLPNTNDKKLRIPSAMFETRGNVSISDLPTSQLLAELDRRNIRYQPTASRRELEQLLTRGKDDKFASGPNQNLAEIVSDLLAAGVRLPKHASRRELERLFEENRQQNRTQQSPPSSRKRSRKYVEIPRLLKELKALGISYPHNASPATLERLIREQANSASSTAGAYRSQSRVSESDEASSQKQKNNAQKSITDILAQLTDCGIRFSPGATQDELEQLLRDHRQLASVEKTNTGDIGRTESQENAPDSSIIAEDGSLSDSASITSNKVDDRETVRRQKLRYGLARRGIPFSQNTTYDELKQLWRSPASYAPCSNESRSDLRQRHQRPRQTIRSKHTYLSKRYGKGKRTVSSSLFDSIPEYLHSTSGTAKRRLSQVTERAARKARYYTRNVRDFFAEDEDGIRDADYYYISKDIPIDVAAESLSEQREKQRGNIRSPNTESFSPQSDGHDNRDYKYDRARESDNPSVRRRRRKLHRGSRLAPIPTSKYADDKPMRDSALRSPLFHLPPASLENDVNDGDFSREAKFTRKQKNRNGEMSKSQRPVYAPYGEDGTPSEAYRDSMGRFGDFVANTAENILWGKLDGKDHSRADVAASREGKQERRKHNDTSYARGHISWKDRLEERFDTMLGIHEDGEYYNRWTRAEDEEKKNEGGYDAISVAQSRAPKQNRRRKKKFYDKPFWEYNNMISSLFGKVPPSDCGHVLDNGYLLPLCKTFIKGFILLATNACEWASVRGSLPQPVVVVGVTSCVLSARPGRRLLTLAVVLGIFRIVGELLHEAMHGNEDWEDEHLTDKHNSSEDLYDGIDF